MYAVTPAVAAAWRSLLAWVVQRAGLTCEVIDYPPPSPLSTLWQRDDVRCVFMCGYPLMLAMPQPHVLAAPVPSPVRYQNAPIYWSEIVVRADSGIERIDQLFGSRFAFTSEHSQSGYQAARALFAPHARSRDGKLFSALVGPLVTPRRVIEDIRDGEADAGPVDSYALDLIRLHEPELVSGMRTIATTAPTPIPPFVAAADTSMGDRQRLKRALLAVGLEDGLREVRNTLLLTRFTDVDVRQYAVLIDTSRRADAQGYPRLA
jgi:ABC-type phosphate/phosphonate transport system substrate-binding protein